MIKGVSYAHLGPIRYQTEPSDSPNQFIGWDFFWEFWLEIAKTLQKKSEKEERR